MTSWSDPARLVTSIVSMCTPRNFIAKRVKKTIVPVISDFLSHPAYFYEFGEVNRNRTRLIFVNDKSKTALHKAYKYLHPPLTRSFQSTHRLGIMSRATTFYDLKPLDAKGGSYDFKQLYGKVVLIVNVASQCGYTPQYEELESLYRKYKDKGFVHPPPKKFRENVS